VRRTKPDLVVLSYRRSPLQPDGYNDHFLSEVTTPGARSPSIWTQATYEGAPRIIHVVFSRQAADQCAPPPTTWVFPLRLGRASDERARNGFSRFRFPGRQPEWGGSTVSHNKHPDGD
jgi:hypothetical protein